MGDWSCIFSTTAAASSVMLGFHAIWTFHSDGRYAYALSLSETGGVGG